MRFRLLCNTCLSSWSPALVADLIKKALYLSCAYMAILTIQENEPGLPNRPSSTYHELWRPFLFISLAWKP